MTVGNDTSTIPTTMLNYLAAIRSRVGSNPIRLRIGGNSMDTSKYVAKQGAPMVQRVDRPINRDNQPVNYGPVVWDVLSNVASRIGGAAYIIGMFLLSTITRSSLKLSLKGLSLINPDDPDVPVVAGASAWLHKSRD